MAAAVAEVAGSPWFLSPGAVGFLVLLLLLSIVLTALCSNCGRRSFELQDLQVDKNPSALIRVVKLEDTAAARENPMIGEIQKDETEFRRNEETAAASFTPWRSHLGAPHNSNTTRDVRTNGSAAVIQRGSDAAIAAAAAASAESNPGEERSVHFLLQRSYLTTSQKQDVNSSTPPDHIYHTIGGGRGDAKVPSPPTNQEQGREESAEEARDGHSVYAKVSKKARQATPPVHTPEAAQVEEEEEESLPPLPVRK